MTAARYTPGHGGVATDYMSRRTFESHGGFFAPHLRPGLTVLDCGCGPGTITVGIAARVAPGRVVGVDFGPSQVERAKEEARRAACDNVEFRVTDIGSLPFAVGDFDRVFSHAMMEHVPDAPRAVREMHRVLAQDGVIGLCSPDWGGFILTPRSDRLIAAAKAYSDLQTRNGGDVRVGGKLGTLLADAGFVDVRMGARYECPDPLVIGEFLALQLDDIGAVTEARTFREWSKREGALFAISWVSATGRKP